MATGWDKTMETGVPQVDNEHRELFRQIANLNKAMSEGQGRNEIGNILNFLGEYVLSHFAHEEKHMDTYKCPAAVANKAAHAQFIAKFKDLKTRFESSGGNSSLTIEINDTLQNWLVQHIRQIDVQLLPCTKTAKKEPALAMSK
jgi:hemerythrin